LTPLDIERLHSTIETITDSNHPYRKRAMGVTTAYLYMMLGEVQVGDSGNCYIYVTASPKNAGTVREDFRRLLWTTEQQESHSRDAMHIHLPETDQDFFFCSLDYFCLPFSFAGTRVHKVFFDTAPAEYGLYKLDCRGNTKAEMLESRGTEIV
jgi:hypothetical protein